MPGRKHLLLALLIVGPALIIGSAFLFAPKAATPRDEFFPEGEWTLLAQGDVGDGDRRHQAGGEVYLYGNGTAHFLRFEDYTARSGPDVWFYLVRDPGADSARSVEDEGVRLRVPGPGQATYRGQFNVPVPESVDPRSFDAVVAWCKTFNTRYAVAPLAPAEGPDGQG